MKKITVALITCNRIELFKKAVISFFNLIDDSRFKTELIVINNSNSKNEETWFKNYLLINNFNGKFFYEERKGVSFPRNKAIELANESEYLAFFDDDETLDVNWLSELFTAIEKNKADIVGGYTIYQYPKSAPKWMVKHNVHGSVKPLPDTIAKSAATNNVMYRISFLNQNKLWFEPKLAKIGGEDSLIFKQIINNNGIAINAPKALSFEEVHKERISLYWLLRRHYNYGYSHSLQEKLLNSRKNAVFNIMKEASRHMIGIIFNFLKAILRIDSIYLFFAARHFSKMLGRIFGLTGFFRYEEYK